MPIRKEAFMGTLVPRNEWLLHEGQTRIDVEKIFSSGSFPEWFATMHAYELKTLNSTIEVAEGYNIAY